MDKIRWGIIGTGFIASQFAQAVGELADAEVTAVASRVQATADRFGDSFGIPNRYGGYEAMAFNAEVDAVYVATPHHLHMANSMMCLDAGKAVLCEKPFAINADQARAMIMRARRQKLFLMEAMWTRFLPLMDRLRQLLAQHVIGELRMLTADFGFQANPKREGRLFDPHTGGGALLDVGVYPVSLAHHLFGRPKEITGAAHMGQTGVDEQAAVVFSHARGELALLSMAISTDTPLEAVIMGSEGMIRIHAPWWFPKAMTLSIQGKADQVIEQPYIGNGYGYEAEAVAACLRQGKLEHDLMPLNESLVIMETMDKIRSQWGLRYPME